jgi:hypothetical protein
MSGIGGKVLRTVSIGATGALVFATASLAWTEIPTPSPSMSVGGVTDGAILAATGSSLLMSNDRGGTWNTVAMNAQEVFMGPSGQIGVIKEVGFALLSSDVRPTARYTSTRIPVTAFSRNPRTAGHRGVPSRATRQRPQRATRRPVLCLSRPTMQSCSAGRARGFTSPMTVARGGNRWTPTWVRLRSSLPARSQRRCGSTGSASRYALPAGRTSRSTLSI